MTPEGKSPKGNMPEKGYVTLRADGGLTHIILWKPFADTPSVPYVPESALLASEEKVKELENHLGLVADGGTFTDKVSSLEKRLAEAEEREKKLIAAIRQADMRIAETGCPENGWEREPLREALKGVVESENK